MHAANVSILLASLPVYVALSGALTKVIGKVSR
jgi:hypothetical protein